ncbi:MAG: hypothetical protein K6E36_09300 [Oscillospiraceae bacterium]|nr:hypothetical protein [Oscillospiraceae bacterium]
MKKINLVLTSGGHQDQPQLPRFPRTEPGGDAVPCEVPIYYITFSPIFQVRRAEPVQKFRPFFHQKLCRTPFQIPVSCQAAAYYTVAKWRCGWKVRSEQLGVSSFLNAKFGMRNCGIRCADDSEWGFAPSPAHSLLISLSARFCRREADIQFPASLPERFRSMEPGSAGRSLQ